MCIERVDGRLCGRRTYEGNRCEEHRPRYEARQSRQAATSNELRLKREPWRALYRTKAWAASKLRALNRDGWRCRALMPDGSRCVVEGKQGGLEVHHTRPLRDLWEDAQGDWTSFSAAACYVGHLVTLCAVHHRYADEDLRRAARERS